MKLKLAIFIALVLAGCNPAPREDALDSPSESKVFPIGGYSGIPERDKAAGFTIVGPVYGTQRERILEEAEKAGLPCIYTVGMELDFLGKKGPELTVLDQEAVRAEIRRQVEAVMDHAAITVWYLIPEELRHWKSLEMDYLRIASETIRETDPKKRPVWMYEPGHRDQASLEKTFPYQQLVGKGVYPNYSGRRVERGWVPWTLGQQAGAIQAVNPKAVPYGILEMFKTPKDDFPLEDIPVWVRHDAYAALIAGVQGFVIFSFGNRAGFNSATEEYNAYYQAWSEVANELNGPLQLGSVVLAGTPVSPPVFEIASGPQQITLSASKADIKEPVKIPSISTAAFTWSGKTYWLLVNSSNETMRLTVNGKLWTPLLEGQPTFNAGDLTLPPLAVAVFRANGK